MPPERGAASAAGSGTVRVSRLGASDASYLRDLNVLFGDAFNEQETYSAAPPSRSYLEELLSKEHILALAATDGDEVVGGLVAYELDKFEKERRELYIYDLAVSEPRRRSGIATKLIRHLQEIAAARGAWVIFVQANYGDDPAINLYEQFGAREDVLHFDIPVAED
jgi:aminoglycoside 3-N-acetyltransferase I